MLPTQSDWTRRGVFATRPALRETNPTNSTPPARVRGRSGEAGEGKPLPFLGTQELTEAAPPKPPPLPEVGSLKTYEILSYCLPLVSSFPCFGVYCESDGYVVFYFSRPDQPVHGF